MIHYIIEIILSCALIFAWVLSASASRKNIENLKKLKSLKSASEELSVKSDRNYRHYKLCYEKLDSKYLGAVNYYEGQFKAYENMSHIIKATCPDD